MATAKKVATSSSKTKRVLSTPKKAAAKRIVKTKTLKSSGSLRIQDKTGSITAPVPAKKKTSRSVKKEASRLPALPSQLGLAIMSPYRFPIEMDKIAMGTARIGGVFFVLIGAFFTLLLVDDAIGHSSMTATTIDSTYSQDGSSSSGTTLTTNVNTKPQAELIVNNPTEVKGSVQMKVKVPMATKVTLLGYFKTQGREVTFGSPKKVSDDTWEMYVDTTKYDDGEYKLKALIVNQYGTYEAVDDKYLRFINTLKETSTDTTTTTSGSGSSNTGSDTSNTASSTTAGTGSGSMTSSSLTFDKSQTWGEFKIELTSEAEKVKVYAKDKAGAVKLLGYAYKAGSTTWIYRWDLSSVQPGTYEVYAFVDAATDYQSNSMIVTIVSETTSSQTPSTTTNTATTTTTTTTTQSDEKPLAPEIKVSLDKNSPLSNLVNAKIDVEGALGVEVFALPKNSLVQKYLGFARKVDTKVWLYTWDTRTLPNGEYKLLVYVKNAYGRYTKESSSYTVKNELVQTYTEEQQGTIDTLSKIAQEQTPISPLPVVPKIQEPVPVTAAEPAPADQVTPLPIGEPADAGEPVVQTVPENSKEQEVAELIAEFREDINKQLQLLASALRVKDENAIFQIKEKLNRIKRDIVAQHIGAKAESELIAVIDSYLAQTIQRVEEDVVRVQKVIEERTALKAETDSDKDGVSDYDEIALYKTDPYTADSDGDGFPDGAEILKGYDPLNEVSEALIEYESPKEVGIVREDLLKVESVISASQNEGEEIAEPAALISGKGLPNSFVTLYIFSTPIVVTVKTDSEGNWNYRFDKELEDGEHQVYVGVTDNAGKIVAKSEPFTFVKEAQAFTGSTTLPPQTVEQAPVSFASKYALYLVLSISVVAIGLVLILLGLHLDTRGRKELAIEKANAAV